MTRQAAATARALPGAPSMHSQRAPGSPSSRTSPGQGLKMSGPESRGPLCHSGMDSELSERMCTLRILGEKT